MPSASRAKSCLTVVTRALRAASSAAGFGGCRAGRRRRRRPGGGSTSSSSPLKPVAVGPLSCAGTSSLRRYLSGSSAKISNSIGTRLSPRTCRVRPVAVNDFTAASFASPPIAWRALARMAAGSLDCAHSGCAHTAAARPYTTIVGQHAHSTASSERISGANASLDERQRRSVGTHISGQPRPAGRVRGNHRLLRRPYTTRKEGHPHQAAHPAVSYWL